MANYEALKATIAQYIKENHANDISGNLLQQQLLAMVNSLGVGYQYVGTATPATNPGTPDQNVFYIASTAGTYTNFGGLVLADGEIAILKYNGAWSKDSTGAASLEMVNQLGQYVDNPEWVKVVTDSEDKILEGIKTDGTKVENLPIETLSARIESLENPEWLQVITDKDGKIIEGITTEGKKKVMVGTEIEGVDIKDMSNSLDDKVDKPVSSTNNNIVLFDANGGIKDSGYNIEDLPSGSDLPSGGNNGDVLKTDGNGNYYWDDTTNPTQAQVDESVDVWLNAHPEATTTVQDGSITPAKIASGVFIAGGSQNQAINWTERDTDPHDAHLEGVQNRVYEWEGHSEGANCFTDGKIGHSEGNACICSGNDAHAEGNRTVTGRKYFTNAFNTPYLIKGSEDAGDSLGTLNYVIIPDSYGDVTSYFPNKLTDNIESRYGAGSQKDYQGNIYPSGTTPAVWSGNTVTEANDLRWAMHCYCILRGVGESSIEYVKIAKATYTSGIGTKVYYYGNAPYTDFRGIYSSYAPTIFNMGNGQHSEGYYTSAVGYGAHSEGKNTEAWGSSGSHAEGHYCKAYGDSSHAEGYNTRALGLQTHTEGDTTIALNINEHAEGSYNKSNSSSQVFGSGGNTLFSIGFGTSEETRKNAIEVMQNGDIYVYGVGGYDGTNANASGVKTLQQVVLNQ